VGAEMALRAAEDHGLQSRRLKTKSCINPNNSRTPRPQGRGFGRALGRGHSVWDGWE